ILEALCVIIQDLVGTEGPHVLDILSPRRRDGMQPSAKSELNRVGSDVSRSSVNDHSLTGFEASVVEQSLPRRDSDDRNGSSFGIAQRAWFLREHPSRGH